MRKTLTIAVTVCVLLLANGVGFAAKKKDKRAKIDAEAAESIERLFEENAKAKALFERSFAYAAFDNTQTALIISGGGGKGVGVERSSGERTYMKMASAGVGIGIGIQMMKTVFLFETESAYRKFVDEGWDADTSASAAAGDAGINAQSEFVNEMMVYQMTEKGLIAQASLKGTKYWKWDKLN